MGIAKLSNLVLCYTCKVVTVNAPTYKAIFNVPITVKPLPSFPSHSMDKFGILQLYKANSPLDPLHCCYLRTEAELYHHHAGT